MKNTNEVPIKNLKYTCSPDVFDFETTGFNAGGIDSIIEIGAVKICNGEIIDKGSHNELINRCEVYSEIASSQMEDSLCLQ